MNITLCYPEIQNYIKGRWEQEIGIGYVSHDTIAITFKTKVAFVPVSKTIDVKVDSAVGSDVELTYSGGFATNLLVRSLMAYMQAKVPDFDKLVHFSDSSSICVKLGSLASMKKLFETVSLICIKFTPTGAEISLALKRLFNNKC